MLDVSKELEGLQPATNDHNHTYQLDGRIEYYIPQEYATINLFMDK